MPSSGFDAQHFLRHLTSQPGVYRMYDSDGVVIYVGKAKNLKKRLSSYFRENIDQAKTQALVKRIANIDVTVVSSETEAFLLENTLIKKYMPRYNVLLRDDKSYPYIFLSSHTHPRLAFHRGPQKAKGEYFGPYISSWVVKQTLHTLQKIFPVRQCEDGVYRNRSRPCLQYQLQRCSAPCVSGHVSDDEYAEQVAMAKLFLQGKDAQATNLLINKMDSASERLDFEMAARYRDQIAALKRVQEQQYVSGTHSEMDVFGVASAHGKLCVYGVFIRENKILGNKAYFPSLPKNMEDTEALQSFILQFYLNCQRLIPKEIVLPLKLLEQAEVESAIANKAGYKIKCLSNVRAERKQYLSLANKNAANSLQAKLADKLSIEQRYADLENILELDTQIQRMECFDISHTMGQETVASCVVFNRAGPFKTDYRRYNIDNITPGDDYAAMRQVLSRRYKYSQQDESKIPDIVFIDGGKGQLAQAEAHFSDWPYNKVPLLVGVAKGTSRKPGLETIIIGYTHQMLHIDADRSGLHLVQHIRDESHRFAITGHRNRRQKVNNRSVLEKIAGVGPKRRQTLLKQFGGLAGLKKASRKEIAKVSGISDELAEIIYDHLHL